MPPSLRLLTIGIGIRTFGAALYNPFLALFLFEVLHVGYLEIGLIFVGVGGLQVPFGLLGGFWTDRVGRRPLIVLGLAAEALFTAGLAYTFELRSLGGAVAVTAIGGSVLAATSAANLAYIADLTAGSERTVGFTWYRIGYNAGFAAGVALGGFLVLLVGFEGAVAAAAGIIAGAALLVHLGLPPSPYDRALAGASAPIAPAPRPRRGGERSLRASFARLRRDRTALAVAAALTLLGITVAQWSVTFPLFARTKLGIPYDLLGAGLALNGLIVVFGQSIMTGQALGRRHTSIAIVGALLYVGAYLLLGASALGPTLPGLIFLLSVVLLTLGENLSSIPASTLPSNLAPPGETGAYNGAFNAFQSVAALAAVFLGGAVLAAVPNPLVEWVLLVLPALAGVGLLRLVAHRVPEGAARA